MRKTPSILLLYGNKDGVFMHIRRKIYIWVLILAVLITGGLAVLQTAQQQLAGKLIRLHVVARSDSPHDQQVKLSVRDAVLAAAGRLIDGAPEPRAALAAGLDEIALAAQERLRELGEDAQVRVRLGRERFPTREYDTFSLPAGVYESLRVTIGDGEGHNWWCVAFPSLCLSATSEEFASKAAGAGFPDSLTGALDGEKAYEVRFFLLDALGELENFLFAG